MLQNNGKYVALQSLWISVVYIGILPKGNLPLISRQFLLKCKQNSQILQGFIFRILQHFAMKLWNVTNFTNVTISSPCIDNNFSGRYALVHSGRPLYRQNEHIICMCTAIFQFSSPFLYHGSRFFTPN